MNIEANLYGLFKGNKGVCAALGFLIPLWLGKAKRKKKNTRIISILNQ
jgi:hypothetical protein